MTSTEQKNITSPFISHCYTYGIIPTIMCRKFGQFGLRTDGLPFEDLGSTANLDDRLWNSQDPIKEAKKLFPILQNAKSVTRVGPFILGLCNGRNVKSGNQAVLRLAEALITGRWLLTVKKTGAVDHAMKNYEQVYSALAPGGYSQAPRAGLNARRVGYQAETMKLRGIADAMNYIATGLKSGRYSTKVRSWCRENRESFGLSISYRKDEDAVECLKQFVSKNITSLTPIPEFKQSMFISQKRAKTKVRYCSFGGHHYFLVDHMDYRKPGEKLELFCLSYRDLDDLKFLIHSASLIKLYHKRRSMDTRGKEVNQRYARMANHMWVYYLNVMNKCGANPALRNKLGVYFDVLQWRYLAWKSGCEFYDHQHIMAQKIQSKGLDKLPDQTFLLIQLKQVEMDIAVDLLGMYKASIYPEVDPFEVVVNQHKLHMSRFMTDWEKDSAEAVRFGQTRQYMWYLGIQVINKKLGVWPGRIREGVEHQDWHKTYRTHGIPGSKWGEAHDVDLTGCIPVTDITDEQYMRQQDSACAPPFSHEYVTAEALKKAPKSHKRKLLYAIQEPSLPNLSESMETLNRIGCLLPDGYTGEIEHGLPFSTDIVTGSRSERHKDAPRPFYAASPPWGCMLSYVDGITRDFLSFVPQSMLGLSTRQKYIDISTASRKPIGSQETFYMSDDKAKYSPRMDPNSQQLPAEFFSEIFNIPAIKAIGPIMYHNNLFYRVCGHLVSYNSNGTDREGMRGASNTWLEIVAQGLATRLCRESGLIYGKSLFLSFIDDGLRRFSISKTHRTDEQVLSTARKVVDDVVFGLRVLGRELSWDKTFVSRDMFVILNELMFDGAQLSSGLKSFCTAGDIELKAVMTAADYEQLYFGKMRGAHGVGAPLDICHTTYIFETMIAHFKLGINLQDNHRVNKFEYRLFCITPVAMGGGGIRSQVQMCCNEVANATKEGIGNLMRFATNYPFIGICVEEIISQPMQALSPVDYMREPEQCHVPPPRIRTQRLAAEVRRRLKTLASNTLSRSYMDQDEIGMELLHDLGSMMMALPSASAEEVRLLYSASPVSFIDEFVQKLASSSTIAALLDRAVLNSVRRASRLDLLHSLSAIRPRAKTQELLTELKGNERLFSTIRYYVR